MEWLSYSRNNQEMVDKFTRLGIIESSEVERAFRCVSRAAFVPDDLLDDAFKDTPLRGSHHVHLSAPHMYAAILEELELDVGMSFLNVGSGTGYFSTLAGYVIKKDGVNHGIELHEDLVSFANERVTSFLENGPLDSKDICTPVFISGNACRLDADQIKYDRLYCGAACSQSNVKFLLKMVKVGGFLIAPVGFRLIKLKRVSLKEGRQSVINDVSFAPLVPLTPEEMKLVKLRFPETYDKKSKRSSIMCDVSFPVSKSPSRKSLAKLRAFQEAIACLQIGKPLPMPFCYVPCFDDLGKSKSKLRRPKDKLTTPTTSMTGATMAAATTSFDSEHTAVDSQIDFFTKISASSSTSKIDLSKDAPEAESTRQFDTSSSSGKKCIETDWEQLSTDKTWLEVLENYYSLCATTEARKRECTNIKMEKIEDQWTFKKYAKQMGLIPSRGKKKSCKGDSKGDAPVVEEVANDIVENLLEEVISQVDENDLAEDFLAAVTGTGPYANGDIRRRSSVARAIILDNLPRLRAYAEESGGLSQTLQGLIRNFDAEEERKSEESRDSSQGTQAKDTMLHNTCMRDVHAFVNNVIADIDKQILHDIASDADIANHLESDEIPPLQNEAEKNEAASHIPPVEGISCNFHSNLNLNSDVVFVKREGSGYFSSKGDTTDFESFSSGEAKHSFSSFVVEDKNLKPESDRFTLLEQKNALLKQKAVGEPVSGNTKFDVSDHQLQGGCKKDVFSADLIQRPASFEIHENPFRNKSFCHEANDGDLSSSRSSCCCSKFQLNYCLEKSSESTPNKFHAPARHFSSCRLKFSCESLENVSCSCSSSSSCERQVHHSLESNADKNVMEFDTFNSSCSSDIQNASDSNPISVNCQPSLNRPDIKDACLPNRKDFLSKQIDLCTSCQLPDGFVSDELYGASSGVLHSRDDADILKLNPGAEIATAGLFFGSPALDNSSIDSDRSDANRHHTTVSEIDTNSSLLASTPVHKSYTFDNEPGNVAIDMPSASYPPTRICPDGVLSEKGPSPEQIASKHLDSKQLSPKLDAMETNEKDAGVSGAGKAEQSRKSEPPFVTSYTSTFKKKKKQRKMYKNVRMDVTSSKIIRSLPGKEWGLQHDKELVLYLSRKEKTSSHVAFSNCCASVINPKCFSSTDLIQYKRICSFPADALARRGIVLRRLADVLDSVMNVLVGPSLVRDQFKTPYDKDYPLKSLTEASFESSGIPLEFNHEEKEGNGTERKQEVESSDGVETTDGEGKTDGKNLMETMNKMISQELENVRKQKEIVCTKLNLYDNLNAEYNEQLRLIKEQVGLVEEQQQLLQTRLRVKFSEENWRQTLLQTEQMILERKLHKKELSEQLEAIKVQREEKVAEHEALLEIHRQLTGLENGLVEERNSSLKMGACYLENGEGKLNRFAKCVKQSNEIVNQLTALNDVLAKEVSTEGPVDDVTDEPADSAKENPELRKNRYHPHLLLAKSRFLFPLTSKRLSIIKELLRMSETDSLHPCFVARIDRRVPLKERHTHPPANTVFLQTYNALKNKDLNFRDVKRNFEKLWEVKFIGEGIIDQGGGFRDSLAEIADELCPASTEIKECLPLFIKTPNQRNETGDHRDAYIPSPSCKDFHLYTWIGKLIGAAFRTDETLPFAFPPFIWKLLIGEGVTWSNDYVGVDQAIVRVTDGIELLDEETYEQLYQPLQSFSVHLSDGKMKELIGNGSQLLVKTIDRCKYAKMVRKARMQECTEQVKAMRDGLITVVPEALLSCLTWQDFERGVCGSPEITVSDLKANCRYELDLSPTVDCVAFLWEALASFSSEERSKFIRFVTGRKRLPSPFFVSRSSTDEDSLPTASTCGSNLFLPNYTNAKIAAEKIRYAINNCVSIDTDTSPW